MKLALSKFNAIRWPLGTNALSLQDLAHIIHDQNPYLSLEDQKQFKAITVFRTQMTMRADIGPKLEHINKPLHYI
jgi:hypothetical protein